LLIPFESFINLYQQHLCRIDISAEHAQLHDVHNHESEKA
ncbi:22647_t:CDS:1, partial [Gigaspora margarita]